MVCLRIASPAIKRVGNGGCRGVVLLDRPELLRQGATSRSPLPTLPAGGDIDDCVQARALSVQYRVVPLGEAGASWALSVAKVFVWW